MTRDRIADLRDRAEKRRIANSAAGPMDHHDALIYELVRDLAQTVLDQDAQLHSLEARAADLEAHERVFIDKIVELEARVEESMSYAKDIDLTAGRALDEATR